MRQFLKENPQVLLLLVITLVLGLGTFIAVIAGLVDAGAAGGAHPTGEPAGAVRAIAAFAAVAR